MDELELARRNAMRRERYATDGGRRKKYNQKWKDANRDLVRAREREGMRKRAATQSGYRSLWLSNIRLRAKRKGLPFNLTLDDLVFPKLCPVLGIPLQERSGKFADNSPSVDRIVPSLGYVKGNVQVISYRANRIKCHATLDELKMIVDYIENEEGAGDF